MLSRLERNTDAGLMEEQDHGWEGEGMEREGRGYHDGGTRCVGAFGVSSSWCRVRVREALTVVLVSTLVVGASTSCGTPGTSDAGPRGNPVTDQETTVEEKVGNSGSYAVEETTRGFGSTGEEETTETSGSYAVEGGSWEDSAQAHYVSSLLALRDTLNRFEPDDSPWTDEKDVAQSDAAGLFRDNFERFRDRTPTAPPELEEVDAYLLRALQGLNIVGDNLTSVAPDIAGMGEDELEDVRSVLGDLREADELATQRGVPLDPEDEAPELSELEDLVDERLAQRADVVSDYKSEQTTLRESQAERQYREDESYAARAEDYEAYESVVSYTNPLIGAEVEVVGQVRSAPYVQGGPRSLEEEAAAFYLDSVPGGTVWEATVISRDVALVESAGLQAGDYVRVRGTVADVAETDSRDRNQPTPLIEPQDIERVDEADATDPTKRNFVIQ